MGDDTRTGNPIYNLLPLEIKGFNSLVELALDMRSTYNHAADAIWHYLAPELWSFTHNPWVVLQTVSRAKIESALAVTEFRDTVERLIQSRRHAVEQPAWFQLQHAGTRLTRVAYFSMEFMLSESLPIYSGGLGNVAGDQLKAASDLGVPVVGVGLLYQQGYFRQVIDKFGWQQALYPYNDPGQLPIVPLRDPNGEWLRVRLDLPGYTLWLRAWVVQVGRVALYLLDSNDAANLPTHRGITSELYGGGPELRLMQELVLGIGGWRLLEQLQITPQVCHLNEGHAAFAVLERTRSFMQRSVQPFDVALSVTRAGNLFTTHTALEAGFDRFSPRLMEQYLGRYAHEELGLSTRQLLALGRSNPDDDQEPFNMAYLAIRGSGAVNAVSQLHGQVSRRIFSPLFPHWPESEVPVGHVTNGVHMPSWDSEASDELWTQLCGKDRWRGMSDTLELDLSRVSDEQLWQFRIEASRVFVEYARQRLARQLTASGASEEDVEAAKHLFNPNTLTLGFARRFATYKRPNMLLHDPDRLARLLTNPERPVQLVIAGKAHPADQAGQELIHAWVEFIRQPQIRQQVAFLSDYDMLLTEHLVQGVDVWINTPRRPWEASGTSGMKVLVNGGLNLSELDGWWAEAYTPEVGWKLGDGQEHGDDPAWDAVEAQQLYDILEQQVIPEFYQRDAQGIPTRWLARMRASMSQLTPRFSASRTVRQYTEQHYLPASEAFLQRAAFNGAVGNHIVNWERGLQQRWPGVRIGRISAQSHTSTHDFEVQVDLNGLPTAYVLVELYADGEQGGPPVRQPLLADDSRQATANGPPGKWTIYSGSVSSARPARHFTPRVLPQHPRVALPLELPLICWPSA